MLKIVLRNRWRMLIPAKQARSGPARVPATSLWNSPPLTPQSLDTDPLVSDASSCIDQSARRRMMPARRRARNA
jgi:hypothetical protein